jgi:hypothetical protein
LLRQERKKLDEVASQKIQGLAVVSQALTSWDLASE